MAEAKAIARGKDGCRISYRIYANPGKPRLALIHSLALSGAMWSEVAKELSGSRGNSCLRLPRARALRTAVRPLQRGTFCR